MKYFSLYFDSFCLAVQCAMHLIFVSRLTGKRQRVWHFACYFLLLCFLAVLCGRFSYGELLAVGAQVVILYGMNRFILKNRGLVSWSASVLAVYISQLSFGMLNSAEAVWFPGLAGKWILYVFLVLATAAGFAVCACCYIAAFKLLSLEADKKTPYMELLLFPELFFLVAELYIMYTSYHTPVPMQAKAGEQIALFSLQALGLAALFCTLYAYRCICRGLWAQAKLDSLNEAAKAQKVYVAESKKRYEQTKAFRHDVKNHLSVLGGLLAGGKLEEGRAYLKKLEIVSASLSIPCQTGNSVVDILLGEKLGLAKADGIAAEVSLILPKPCRVDEFDLCVIFANALD
ncbi:MAG: sensor histidine kinase, partial [Lachnospiraceae bacterium]|nr:sensor histidine kinase [Lachnospiraceae bacterium]